MALVFHIKNKENIVLDSNIIIGVMGDNYEKFLSSISGKQIYYVEKESTFNKDNVYDELLLNYDTSKSKIDFNSLVISILKELDLEEVFLHKKICNLSNSEIKLLKYLVMLVKNPRIIIIDEPFLDLDYKYKKKITLLFKRIVKETRKSIIIGSVDSDMIYSLCKKVLFINNDSHYYGNIDIFNKITLLKKYNVSVPQIVEFVNLASSKGINIPYSRNVGDLIKDVYRNVSKKKN